MLFPTVPSGYEPIMMRLGVGMSGRATGLTHIGATTKRRGLLGIGVAVLTAVTTSITNVREVLAAPLIGTTADGTPAVSGTSTAASPPWTPIGVSGLVTDDKGAAIRGTIGQGISVSPGGSYAVFGLSNAQTSIKTYGVYGTTSSTTAGSAGVMGAATASGPFANAGVYGRNSSLDSSGSGVLGECTAFSSTCTGVKGLGTSGVGVIGSSTANIGVYGASTTNVGVFGDAGNNTAVMGRTAQGIGIYGTATNPGGGGRAAVFDGTVLVNGPFTVVGGPKSAGVRLPDGSIRRMYCQEAPESYFEDFGTSTLTQGVAKVTLDPDFRATVNSDTYHVFMTELGDMGGLFLARKDAASFEVRSRLTTATGEFSYRIVAKRRDEVGRRMERIEVQPVKSRDVRSPDLHAPGGQDEAERERGTR
jgi:hypothetical protein